MNFFEHQAQARKNTGRLVALFTLTVVLIIIACYIPGLMLVSYLDFKTGGDDFRFSWWQWDVLGWVAGVSIGVIAIGSLWKVHSLAGGGAVVAARLGGKLVNPRTDDPDERRLRNVVEEMAIASGIAVPLVFVLNEEDGMNAFAAGFTPNDAAIAVTRGCLKTLKRDELQAVIAHEFSHILNGDMRLNIRLIGLVHGILAIGLIGATLMHTGASGSHYRSRRRGGGGGVLLMLAIAVMLLVIGYVGVFFGRLIKAAVSRQREFLADASAVNFTRNPDGMAGALKKIGGNRRKAKLDTPAAEEASHIFFGNALRKPLFAANALATHPPLAERIRRIDPSFDGEFPTVKMPTPGDRAPTRKTAAVSGFRPSDTVTVDPSQVVNQVAAPTIDHLAYGAALIASVPVPIRTAAYDPVGAVAVIYALLLDSDEAERQRQLDLLREHSEPIYVQETERLQSKVTSLHPGLRLPLADLAVPALRELGPEQYATFCTDVRHLVAADRMLSVFEFALQKLLLRRLAPHFGRLDRKDVRYKAFNPLLPDCLMVLSFLTRVGHRDVQAAGSAFETAVSRLPKTAAPRQPLSVLPVESCTFKALDRALDRLALASPVIKERVVDACARCVLADGTVTVKEAELLRAVTDALGCPLPPFLPSPGKSLTRSPSGRG
jgi:Zn-dependent protease with chaperone function